MSEAYTENFDFDAKIDLMVNGFEDSEDVDTE